MSRFALKTWSQWRARWLPTVALIALCSIPVHADRRSAADLLPKIGPAPAFTLINQDGKRFSARDMRGRVSVVTFIFTTCSATCPLLTAKLVAMQRQLGVDRDNVFFAAITVDPLNDTPPVLKKYAQAHSADLKRFAFLTGSLKEIEDLADRYAVYQKTIPGGVDHSFLTSIIDREGTLRVQYTGVRFEPNEFLADLKSLLNEQPDR